MMSLPDIANTQADVADFWESQGVAKLVQNKVATSEVLVDGSAISAVQIDANVFPSISVSGGSFQTPGAAGTPAIGAAGGTAAAPGLSTGAPTGGGSASPSTSTPVAVGSGTGIGGAGGGPRADVADARRLRGAADGVAAARRLLRARLR